MSRSDKRSNREVRPSICEAHTYQTIGSDRRLDLWFREVAQIGSGLERRGRRQVGFGFGAIDWFFGSILW